VRHHGLGKFPHFKTSSLLPSPNLTSPHLASPLQSDFPIPTWEKCTLGVLLLQAIAEHGENWNSLPPQLSLTKNATLSMTTYRKLKQTNKNGHNYSVTEAQEKGYKAKIPA